MALDQPSKQGASIYGRFEIVIRILGAIRKTFRTNWRVSRVRSALGTMAVAVVCVSYAAGEQDGDKVLDILLSELDRSHGVLAEEQLPPYFISYEVTRVESFQLSASSGASNYARDETRTVVDVVVRVGDYSLDSTHPIQGRRPNAISSGSIAIDDPDALRRTLWLRTEQMYQRAVERYAIVLEEERTTVAADDQSGDYSKAEAHQFVQPIVNLKRGRGFEDTLDSITAPFVGASHVLTNRAVYWGGVSTRWYVNTDGTAIRVSEPSYGLSISATARSDDGMDLSRSTAYHAHSPSGLPDQEHARQTATQYVDDLRALRSAPLMEPYTGPAILSGRASGVFFHEILGHRLEGDRQKGINDAQTFKNKLGERVLPRKFNVSFDPTVQKFGSTDLAGWYQFDNEGSPGQRVNVIEKGVLTGFLMSRTPIEGFPATNGHGRKNWGRSVVARQSNLFVDVNRRQSEERLKRKLLRMVKRSEKEYGLIFEEIEGGFTFTGRSMPNAFNVTPVMVYRVFPDGREELVRGVDLIGTALTSFSLIVDAGGPTEVFNGTCGADSGPVSVSAVSPSILVSQVEVQKKVQGQSLQPILPAPSTQRSVEQK